jgi:hypothetical protein
MSNMFCKVTARIFIAVKCERPLASFPDNVLSKNVLLTYKQEAIPSPLGMLEFRLVAGQPISVAILLQATEHYLPSTPVDFTGTRLANYMGLLEIL